MNVLSRKVAGMREILSDEIELIGGGVAECRDSESRVVDKIDGVIVSDVVIIDDLICSP